MSSSPAASCWCSCWSVWTGRDLMAGQPQGYASLTAVPCAARQTRRIGMAVDAHLEQEIGRRAEADLVNGLATQLAGRIEARRQRLADVVLAAKVSRPQAGRMLRTMARAAGRRRNRRWRRSGRNPCRRQGRRLRAGTSPALMRERRDPDRCTGDRPARRERRCGTAGSRRRSASASRRRN